MQLWIHECGHLYNTLGSLHGKVDFLVLGGLSTEKRKHLFFNLGELIKHHIHIIRGKCSESRDTLRLIKVSRFLLYFSSLVVCVHFALTNSASTPTPIQSQQMETSPV